MPVSECGGYQTYCASTHLLQDQQSKHATNDVASPVTPRVLWPTTGARKSVGGKDVYFVAMRWIQIEAEIHGHLYSAYSFSLYFCRAYKRINILQNRSEHFKQANIAMIYDWLNPLEEFHSVDMR